jgi:transcriptional regulator with XRE-family HTH domain
VTVKNPHLQELGQFLKARRGELNPADVGLPAGDPGTRRVTGLRREEVAASVAISHDYYTRIEQGRLAPSEPVLEAIANTLRLTPDQRAYAEGLAQQADRRTPPRRSNPVRPQIQRLLDQLTDTPAFVVGKYLDILAWNPLAAALLIDVDKMAPHERNYVRMMFTDPRMKAFYPDWESMARTGWSAEPGSATHDKFRILASWIQAPGSAHDAPAEKTHREPTRREDRTSGS